MPLRPPHEYKIRRSSRSIEMVRENPTLIFTKRQDLRVGTAPDGSPIVQGNPEFHDPILYQDGHFYYENGTEIPKKEVPAYILEHLRKFPPGKPQVLGTREISMTVEEAEREFGDRGLDSRIAARQGQAMEVTDGDVSRRRPDGKRASPSAR